MRATSFSAALRGLLLFLVAVAAMPAAAQPGTAGPPAPDTTVRVMPPLPGDAFARYRADDAYRYDEPPPRPSLLGRLWQDVLDLLGRLYGGEHGRAATWATIVGFGLIVLLLLGRLLGAFATPTAPRTALAPGGDADALPARVETLDFSAWLADALAAGDHRRAVRAVYLRALQTLDRTGAVPYRPDRTNEGVTRLLPPARRPAFRRLARTFERAWYGALPQTRADVDDALAAEVALGATTVPAEVHDAA